MIDNRESTKSAVVLTREFYKWENSCCFNSINKKRKNCCFCNNNNSSTNDNNLQTRSKYRRISEPLTHVSQFELLSNALKLEDFVLIKTLGRGSFGVVHEAQVLDKKRVALKILHRNSDLNHKQQVFRSYEAEKNIKNLKHENLITYYGCNNAKSEHDRAFIVYEFGGKYNLNQVIIDSKIDLTQSLRKSFSLDLVNALEFIHLNNIVHMDLKPANIIVTDRLVLKLTDFGCSIKIDSSSPLVDKNNNSCQQYVNSRWTAGTWFYRAPELFRNDNSPSSNITTSCDIYSLGVCMWQLLTREFPYNGENPHVIIYQIVSKGLRPEFPPPSTTSSSSTNDDLEFEKLYRLIVEKCWDCDSNKRFSAKYIKELLTNNFCI